jgi:hypothetical protein
MIDPWDYLGRSPWVGRWLHRTGGLGVQLLVDRPVFDRTRETAPQLIWVNQGEFLGPKLLRQLRTLAVPIVNYTNDDPFGGIQNRLRFRLYQKALPYYDLVAVVRHINIDEAAHHGAPHVVRVFMSADEIAHDPQRINLEDSEQYASEVAFIGTWMRERGPFLHELIRLGVPISIWGDRWQKAPEWPALRPHWKGPGLYDDRYAKIIMSTKVALGFLSRNNRDFHTTRTMEIPALGAVLCAERTSEHLALYEDGAEAVFWSTPSECADHCLRLLEDESYRKSIAFRGRLRLKRNGHYNERVLAGILQKVAPRMEKSL